MKFKSVCIAGVDGTGKTSTVELLHQRLGEENAFVQYMGAKQWETELMRKYNDKLPTKNPFVVLVYLFAYVREMYHRYYKYNGDKRIIIFDRYAFEHALFIEAEAKGVKSKLMATLLNLAFVRLYPRPDISVYLSCPLEVSLNRKNDINTPKEIAAIMTGKSILDQFYAKFPQTKNIDTSKKEQGEVVDEIMREISKRWGIS